MQLDALTAQIKFCVRCGQAMEYRQKQGRLRPVCSACRYTHFIDPKVAVAVIVERDGQVLMIRRKGQPERGKWSFPAGYMDAGEDPARAAEREALEETGLQVRVTSLFEVFPKFGPTEGADVLIVYCAEIVGGELVAGDDAEHVAFFPAESPPAELAFISTQTVLTHWRARRR